MKNIIRLIIVLVLVILMTSSVSVVPQCGISERVTLENTTDISITCTFTRGSHEGLVVVEPGQVVTVDLVWCE